MNLFPRRRMHIGAITFILLLSVFNLLLYHYPLLAFGVANIDFQTWNGVSTLATVAVIVLSTTTMVLLLLATVSMKLVKAFAVLAALGNAVALYFIVTYGVILDKSMMGNVFNTRSVESMELLHPTLAVWILLLGIVPTWLIVHSSVRPAGHLRLIGYIVVSMVLLAFFIYANMGASLWIDKHSRQIGGVILPWSYLVNATRVQSERSHANEPQDLLPDVMSRTDEPAVVVLVIGEAARAANFSMYGYQRQTNPLLAQSGALALANATACSTYTTASLHCMLSHDGASSGTFEPLPSYLQRNGVDVVWRTNNWGEPRVNVETYEKASSLRATCKEADCDHDEVLLSGLVERIHASEQKKVFIVLHTKGSHGPSYNKRYPEPFGVFMPVCESVELGKCTSEELINAYDNSILYTDHLLRMIIERLKTLSGVPTLMIYVSDHGESLGEFGLYLHGTPYVLAPDVQKNIPFIVWMSSGFKESNGIEDGQLYQGDVSHNNVFHSVMGAFGLNSDIYSQTRDIFNR